MNRKEKRELGRKIAKLEERYQKTKDNDVSTEIEKIALSLSIDDMLELDEYILEKYKNF